MGASQRRRPRIRILAGSLAGSAVLAAGVSMIVVAPGGAAAYGPTPSSSTVPQVSTTTSTTGPAGTVAAATTGTTAHGALAFTGTDVEAATVIGAAAIGAGGLIVLGVRRRRPSNPD